MTDVQDRQPMHTDPQVARLWALAEPVAVEAGLELLDVEHRREGRGAVLRLVLDKPDGISVDELTSVSREVSDLLDVHEALAGAYTLEVSSPGVNRPLTRPAHFPPFVGKRVHVRTRTAHENRHTFRGVLVAVGDDAIQVRTSDASTHTIAFDDIARANYEHEFPAPGGRRTRGGPPRRGRRRRGSRVT